MSETYQIKIKIPRSRFCGVKLTPDEYYMLMKASKDADVTMSEIMRRGLYKYLAEYDA